MRRTTYVDLYFRWRGVRLVFAVLAGIGLVIVFGLWAAARGLFGVAGGTDLLIGVFIVVPVAAVTCGVVAIRKTFKAASIQPQSPVNVHLKYPDIFRRGPVSWIDGRPD